MRLLKAVIRGCWYSLPNSAGFYMLNFILYLAILNQVKYSQIKYMYMYSFSCVLLLNDVWYCKLMFTRLANIIIHVYNTFWWTLDDIFLPLVLLTAITHGAILKQIAYLINLHNRCKALELIFVTESSEEHYTIKVIPRQVFLTTPL